VSAETLEDEEPEEQEPAEEPAREYGVEISGSHLRWYRCSACGAEDALATVERGPAAVCGSCRARATGYAVPDGSVPFSPAVGYPMGTYVPAITAAVPHPAPVVTSRDPMPEGVVVPGPVRLLAAQARTAGWRVVVQYADGWGIHARLGTPTARVRSFAVRMHSGKKRAVAVYKIGSTGTGTWDGVWIFGDRVPYGGAGITELEQYLAADVPEEWFTEISQRRTGQEERKKIREACNRGVHGQTNTLAQRTTCALCDNSWDWKAQPWRREKKSKEHA